MKGKKTAYEKTKKFLSFVDYIIQINTFLLIIGAGFVFYQFQYQFLEIREMLLNTVLGSIFFYFSMFLLVFKIAFLLYVLYHYLRYKAIEPVSDAALPYCTVIVPAYNEGRFVYDTLMSIAKSDYPSHKIQLIAIDDGSKDDTWHWIEQAKEKLGAFLIIYRQPQNAGKREALYKGFKLATGEVFVTIDSDSVIETDTLRNLVSPFVMDQNCGAVAGNVKIHNQKKAIIPKMLNVSFAFSFGFIRSAQSSMKTVLCTPGALSAYRREAVLNCLEEWANQTFLGVKTDIGEDRAMTNMILKQGYNSLFQRNALVYTNIPETYRTLRKMFTRWERSNVRENIMMARFVFTKFRQENKFGARVLLFNQSLTIFSAYPCLIAMLLMIVAYPRLFLSSTIISIAVFSIIPAVYYGIKHGKRNSVWIFTYNLFYTFALFWITPFAIITAGKRGWLTRDINTSVAEQKA
ncbi:MAG TPA: glycosyltransferase family 2 protein [Ferruginibacter sp.]|nr:glycosyltransferase family 2 protein [Ferruginibacter sp.]HMP21565.1 glycosyltransferase family 2 protein [Ferruginibacter sp.]